MRTGAVPTICSPLGRLDRLREAQSRVRLLRACDLFRQLVVTAGFRYDHGTQENIGGLRNGKFNEILIFVEHESPKTFHFVYSLQKGMLYCPVFSCKPFCFANVLTKRRSKEQPSWNAFLLEGKNERRRSILHQWNWNKNALGFRKKNGRRDGNFLNIYSQVN